MHELHLITQTHLAPMLPAFMYSTSFPDSKAGEQLQPSSGETVIL